MHLDHEQTSDWEAAPSFNGFPTGYSFGPADSFFYPLLDPVDLSTLLYSYIDPFAHIRYPKIHILMDGSPAILQRVLYRARPFV